MNGDLTDEMDKGEIELSWPPRLPAAERSAVGEPLMPAERSPPRVPAADKSAVGEAPIALAMLEASVSALATLLPAEMSPLLPAAAESAESGAVAKTSADVTLPLSSQAICQNRPSSIKQLGGLTRPLLPVRL